MAREQGRPKGLEHVSTILERVLKEIEARHEKKPPRKAA